MLYSCGGVHMKKIFFVLFGLLFLSACLIPSFRPKDQKAIYPVEPLHKAVAVSTTTLLNWNIQIETAKEILYDVYLSTDSDQLNNDTALEPTALALKEHFYYPNTPFLPNTVYYWRIMAHIPAERGTEAIFSPLFQFTTNASTKPAPHYHLVTVGVSDYRDGIYFSNLMLPKEDAKDATRVFSKLNEPWKIHPFIGTVSCETVLTELTQIATNSNSIDVLAFHFAGHGLYIPSQRTSLLVFSPVEQVSDYQTLYRSNQTLTVKELKEKLDLFQGKKWAFIDCCQSGAFVNMGEENSRSLKNSKDEATLAAFSQALLDPFQSEDSISLFSDGSYRAPSNQYHILTATQINEDSYEHMQINNGLFSFSLFDGLGDASIPNQLYDFSFDADRMPFNYQIHFNELRSFVQKKVNSLLRELNSSDKKMTLSFYPQSSNEVFTSYFPLK